MKKFALLVLLFLACTTIISAQGTTDKQTVSDPCNFDPEIVIDSISQLECIYQFAEVDTVLQIGRNHELILQIGKEKTMMKEINNYITDSIFRSRNFIISWDEVIKALDDYQSRYLREFKRHADRFSEFAPIVITPVEYTDSALHHDWQLTEDTMTVCGYLCHKAVTHFRGKTWTAWYAEQIPYDAGPWKLYGLPGLILKATDTNAVHDFEAIAVRQPHSPALYETARRHLLRTTRKRFRELEYNAVIDYMGEVEKTGLIRVEQKSNKRSFYSPLELE